MESPSRVLGTTPPCFVRLSDAVEPEDYTEDPSVQKTERIISIALNPLSSYTDVDLNSRKIDVLTDEVISANLPQIKTIERARNWKILATVSLVALSVIAAAAALALAVMIFAPPVLPLFLGAAIAASPLTPYLLPVIAGAATAIAFLVNRGRENAAQTQSDLQLKRDLLTNKPFLEWAGSQEDAVHKLGHIEFYKIYRLLEKKRDKEKHKEDLAKDVDSIMKPMNEQNIKIAGESESDLQAELDKIDDAIKILEEGLKSKLPVRESNPGADDDTDAETDSDIEEID